MYTIYIYMPKYQTDTQTYTEETHSKPNQRNFCVMVGWNEAFGCVFATFHIHLGISWRTANSLFNKNTVSDMYGNCLKFHYIKTCSLRSCNSSVWSVCYSVKIIQCTMWLSCDNVEWSDKLDSSVLHWSWCLICCKCCWLGTFDML